MINGSNSQLRFYSEELFSSDAIEILSQKAKKKTTEIMPAIAAGYTQNSCHLLIADPTPQNQSHRDH